MTIVRNRNVWLLGSLAFLSSAYFFTSPKPWFSTLKLFNEKKRKKSSKNQDEYIYLSDDLSDIFTELPGEDQFSGESASMQGDVQTHWQLLKMVRNSKNQHFKKIAIKALATNKFSDFQYNELSQVCDFQTSILLAQTPKVSLKLFKPLIKPKFINYSGNAQHFNLNDILVLILKEASALANHECTKYFLNLALNLLVNEKSFEVHQHETEEIHRLKKSNTNKIYSICLQALIRLSSNGQILCQNLVQNGLFLVLSAFKEKFPDIKTQTCLAQILANLSMHKELHIHFWLTGWIRQLVEWLNSEKTELQFMASKILSNLATQQNPSYAFTGDSLFVLHPLYYENQSYNVDIIFVHGLLGGAFRTWRQCDKQKMCSEYTQCWPKSWLAEDFEFIRVLGVNYQTYLSDWNIECLNEKFTLKDRSCQLLKDLLKSNVGTKPIIWVAHSMGGLLVKQMLVDAFESDDKEIKKILQQTKGIVFYSVPNKGSELAVWSPRMQRIILPSIEVLELRKDSPFLLNLHEKYLTVITKTNIKCLSFGETLKSKIGIKPLKWNALLVPEESANPGVGQFISLPVDHFNTCKPETKESPAYNIVTMFIKQIVATQQQRWW